MDKQHIGRRCARCGAEFFGDPPFVTCPACRLPVKDDGGGCHWWRDVRDKRERPKMLRHISDTL